MDQLSDQELSKWNEPRFFGGVHINAKVLQNITSELIAARAELKRLRSSLTKLRDLMCEAIEDDDGNSGCGQCENDCTGCIADRALKGGTQ